MDPVFNTLIDPILIYHSSSLTSWYIEGLDNEGMVKDKTLLFPSLSAISCIKKQNQNPNRSKEIGLGIIFNS